MIALESEFGSGAMLCPSVTELIEALPISPTALTPLLGYRLPLLFQATAS